MMNKDEAIECFEKKRKRAHPCDIQYYDATISSLKQDELTEPVTEESYKPCKLCEIYHHFTYKGFKNKNDMVKYINGESSVHVGGGCRFCPNCGRPITKES